MNSVELSWSTVFSSSFLLLFLMAYKYAVGSLPSKAPFLSMSACPSYDELHDKSPFNR
jgi:hypothetical protein